MHPEDNRTSSQIASRYLHRVVRMLAQAGESLDDASRHTPNRYHRDRLYYFASGLRDLSIPLSRLASRLEKDGAL